MNHFWTKRFRHGAVSVGTLFTAAPPKGVLGLTPEQNKRTSWTGQKKTFLKLEEIMTKLCQRDEQSLLFGGLSVKKKRKKSDVDQIVYCPNGVKLKSLPVF